MSDLIYIIGNLCTRLMVAVAWATLCVICSATAVGLFIFPAYLGLLGIPAAFFLWPAGLSLAFAALTCLMLTVGAFFVDPFAPDEKKKREGESEERRARYNANCSSGVERK